MLFNSIAEYDTTSSEYEYNYNIENNADDGHRYVTETDTAGYDTSAFNSLVDQFGNYSEFCYIKINLLIFPSTGTVNILRVVK